MSLLLCFLLFLSSCIASHTPQHATERLQAQPEHAGQGWVEGIAMGVRENDVGVTVIFLNTYSQPDGLAPGVWHPIDVAALGVPRDALAVFISGILIISHGLSAETCNLTLSFRAPGSQALAGNYLFQALEASIFNGIRSNAASIIPVKKGHFELQWNQSSPREKAWPDYCAYGANIIVSMYIRRGVTLKIEPLS